MAIGLRTRILVWATADGQESSFIFDLFKSQFWVGAAQPSGFGVHSPNWFSEKAATLPSGVVVIDGASSASLSGTLITVTLPVHPEGHVYKVTLDCCSPRPPTSGPPGAGEPSAIGPRAPDRELMSHQPAAPNPKSKLPVRKRNRQYGGHDAEIAAMAPGAEAAAALSHFGTVFGSPPGVPGGGITGIAPPSRGGAAIFGSTPEGGQMTPFD